MNGFAALNTTDSSTLLNWTRVASVSGYLLTWRHISGQWGTTTKFHASLHIITFIVVTPKSAYGHLVGLSLTVILIFFLRFFRSGDIAGHTFLHYILSLFISNLHKPNSHAFHKCESSLFWQEWQLSMSDSTQYQHDDKLKLYIFKIHCNCRLICISIGCFHILITAGK